METVIEILVYIGIVAVITAAFAGIAVRIFKDMTS